MKLDAPFALLGAAFHDLLNRPRSLYEYAARYLNGRSEADSAGRLPVVSIFDLVPDASRHAVVLKNLFETQVFSHPELTGAAHHVASTTMQDSYYLALLLKANGGRRILEVGTSYGETSLLFANNSPPDATIVTLDVQSDNPTIGSKFAGDPVASKISFRCQPLSEIAPTLAPGSFDFIFVDGDHSYGGVISDSRLAFELLAPGGTICWHDYTFRFRDDVVRAIDLLRDEGRQIVKLAYVNLAVYRDPRPKSSAAPQSAAGSPNLGPADQPWAAGERPSNSQ